VKIEIIMKFFQDEPARSFTVELPESGNPVKIINGIHIRLLPTPRPTPYEKRKKP
jgi:hypothetical protein